MFKKLPKVQEMWEGDDTGGWVPRKQEFMPWQEWFAWRPVTVNGQRVWLKRVYRRCINTYVDMDDWKRYEYGDIFNVLKDENSLV